MSSKNVMPIERKYTLTISEAARYFGIGEHKIRKLVQENPNAEFVLMNGNRVTIKRVLFERFIDRTSSV